MEIDLFFEPVSKVSDTTYGEGTIGERIVAHTEAAGFPEIKAGTVVLLGVCDARRSENNSEISEGLFRIRKKLYELKDHFVSTEIVDFGDIKAGKAVEDTYYALSSSVTEIVKKGGIALILGGGQDITYANYLAYEKLEQVVNLVSVDSRFDIGDVEDEIRSDQFLQKIILHQPNVLFNYSNMGYQTYYILEKEIDLMRKMYFDLYRLGEVQGQIEAVEPIIRNADIVSFDLSCIRTSDFPGNYRTEPNGFYGEEACAITRYAGLSDKLTSIGFYDYDASVDQDGRGATLVAQMIWYFLWGVDNRKKDYPFADKDDYLKYTVSIEMGRYEIIFYKSQLSDRWWMEVPYPSKKGVKYERHFMVPCSYEDYQNACNEEIPDRWWQTFQKLG
ncbi:formimidoylglutamase [Bacteroidota bacterium]